MEPILDSEYWRNRLLSAREEHHAIFRCPKDRWDRIAAKHTEILRKHVAQDTSILDVGCGWGRVIGLMPPEWRGSYLGIDLCIDFIMRAKDRHPGKLFVCDDVGHFMPSGLWQSFDLALCVSFRPMVKRNLGDVIWAAYEKAIKFLAKRVLYLEYDENDEGSQE